MEANTKWWLLPVAALAVIAGGTGWWGYQQQVSSQAMAAQVSTQYNHSFHGLIGHVENMKEEIEKAQVSGEQTGFDTHLRNIWRLADLASSDIGRLPINVMPMHQTQAFLADVGHQTDSWLRNDTPRNSGSVTAKLDQMDTSSGQLLTQLNKVDSSSPTGKTWTTAMTASAKPATTDNQIVDGFRKLDKKMSGYSEARQAPASVQTMSPTSVDGQITTQAQAKATLANALSGVNKDDLTAKRSTAYGKPEWLVHGRKGPNVYGEVAVDGGQLLSFRVSKPAHSGHSTVDLGTAADTAQRWLASQGFGSSRESQSHVYDKEAYFVWTPIVGGVAELDHDITINVNLTDGKVTGYNAQAAILDRVGSLKPRTYSAAQLKKKLNPAFQVHETQLSVMKVPEGTFTPSVSFYGEYQGRPYRVDMDAVSGREINITRLSGV